VPFLLRWPSRWEGGRVADLPVISLDLYPTFAEAAGLSVPATTEWDGANLLPYLDGEADGLARDFLYWKEDERAAILMDDWKLVMGHEGQGSQLFDLGADRSESNDLAAQKPAKVEMLLQAWKDWAEALPPPANPDAPHRK